MQDVIQTIEDNIEELEKAGLDAELPTNVRKIALNSRASFIKRLHVLAGLKIPNSTESKEIKNFYENTIHVVNETFKRAMPHYRYAKLLFKKQVEFIPRNLKTLENLFKDLKKLLDTYEPAFSKTETVLSSIDTLKEKIRILTENEENIRDIDQKIKLSKDNLRRFKTELEQLMANPEWRDLGIILKSNEKLETELQNIKTGIIQNISPLQKSFKKFSKYTNVEKKSFEERKMLDGYLDSPILTIENDVELVALKSILGHVRNAIQMDKLELKDEKKKRTLTQIKNIMETNALKNLAKTYSEVKDSIKQNNEDIGKIEIQKQKDNLMGNMTELNQQIKDLDNNIQTLNNNKKTITSQINEEKKALEEQLEYIIDSKISIIELPI